MTEKEVLEIIERAAKDGRKYLDLSCKGFKIPPTEIGNLMNLNKLDLGENSVMFLLWMKHFLCNNIILTGPKSSN